MSVEPLAVKSGKLKLGATGTCKGTHSWVWREAEIQACASGKGYKSERKPPPTRQEGRDNAQTDCRGLLSPSPETQGPGLTGVHYWEVSGLGQLSKQQSPIN